MDKGEIAKICIIGAGPAGLMASIHSARSNAATVLLESNGVAGRKLLLTGGGRCNFTHASTAEQTIRAFGSKGRFLRHSFHKFPHEAVRQFFQKHGLKSMVENNGCVFPETDRAGDVRDVLLTEAKKLGVRFLFSEKVRNINRQGKHFTVTTSRQEIPTEKVIIATGGLSYPDTGSKGDGYKFARHFGHTIIEPKASLAALVTLESWPGELAGTSLENVKLTAVIDRKKFVAAGAKLFTHDGIGGPAVLELSRFVTDFLPAKEKPIKVIIDTVSNIIEAELEKIILKKTAEHPKRSIANILAELMPRRFAEVVCSRLDFPSMLYANQLSRDMRRKLLHHLKAMPLSIVGTRPIDEAIVTRGGISTTEIEPKTMESKICPGLYFAGEILDVDGPCGGYNLQMCWSTGALAGISAAQSK